MNSQKLNAENLHTITQYNFDHTPFLKRVKNGLVEFFRAIERSQQRRAMQSIQRFSPELYKKVVEAQNV